MTEPQLVYEPETEGDFWSGLGDAIFGGFISPILDFFNTVWDTIVEWFTNLGKAIYNAVVSFVDSTISFFEYFLNSVRQYIPYAVLITISWTMITRAWKSEKLSFLKKLGITISAPIVGYLVASIFDAIVPIGARFPRLSLVLQPAEIKGSYNHTQYVSESVSLESRKEVIEGRFEHTQVYYEAVVLGAPLIIQETFNHQQAYYEQVTLA